jgi:hypothetical protein
MSLKTMSNEERTAAREKAIESRRRIAQLSGPDSEFSLVAEINPPDVRLWLSKVPLTFRGRLLKALRGEASALQAIRAHCEQCCGWEDIPLRISDCKVWRCALYPLRPYQSDEVEQ